MYSILFFDIDPLIEEWIQCHICNEWCHEQCTPYGGVGAFICDPCSSFLYLFHGLVKLFASTRARIKDNRLLVTETASIEFIHVPYPNNMHLLQNGSVNWKYNAKSTRFRKVMLTAGADSVYCHQQMLLLTELKVVGKTINHLCFYDTRRKTASFHIERKRNYSRQLQ